jgi:hypothetical protein
MTSTRTLSDSDKNIMADLAHEPCDGHCDVCGKCVGQGIVPLGPGSWGDAPFTESFRGHICCEDCVLETDCLAENDPENYTWKNCPCQECQAEQKLEMS